MLNRHEMLDVVIVDGKARGIIARNLVTGEIERHGAHAVLICTGGDVKEYVWLDDTLVAVLSSHAGSSHQYVLTDHLGTPRAVVGLTEKRSPGACTMCVSWPAQGM